VDFASPVSPAFVDTAVCAMGDRSCDPMHPCELHELWARVTAPVEALAWDVTLETLVESGSAPD
jgi:hypothetical protein